MSNSFIPSYVDTRFRQRVPVGVRVVPGSTPVVSFGCLAKARVATLAINPSFREFLDKDGRELDGIDRRLQTCSSLRCRNLDEATQQAIQQALDSCYTYFTGRPYQYFSKLETVLNRVDASFYDGSACHLDLVQWATKPRWNELEPWEREKLLLADVPFLKTQLSNERLGVVIINGSGVRKQYERFFGITLQDVHPRRQANLGVSGGQYINFFQGRTSSGQLVVGWNVNLQSTPGVSNENIGAIAEQIARMVSKSL